jgi:hypothetical protein
LQVILVAFVLVQIIGGKDIGKGAWKTNFVTYVPRKILLYDTSR